MNVLTNNKQWEYWAYVVYLSIFNQIMRWRIWNFFSFFLFLCVTFFSLFSYDWCVSNVCFSMLVNFNDYTVLKFSINIILPSSGLMKAFKKSFIEEPFCIQYIRDVSSRFSSNSEDFASELLEYLDDMFPLYYIL